METELQVSDAGKPLHIFPQASQETELWVGGVLHGRRYWKGPSLVTLGKPFHAYSSGLLGDKTLSWWHRRSLCICIVQVIQETELHFSGVQLGRWLWKGCSLVTLGKTACSLLRSPGRQSSWIGVLALQEFILNRFQLWGSVGLDRTDFQFGGECYGLERTDFHQCTLWYCVVVLKIVIFWNSHFGRVCWSLRTDFGLFHFGTMW